MYVRVLECSVCQSTYDTRKEWLSHLLRPYHQTKAREEICRWGQPERDCALVAFSSLPIASLELLQFFSRGGMDLVTDFVWFDNRPKVGLIQFESRQKVKEILSRFGVPEVRVNNQLVQIKRAGGCLLLEWQNLIPFPVDVDVELHDHEGSGEQDLYFNSSLDILIGWSKRLSNPNPIVAEISQTPDPAAFLSIQYDLICKEIEISDEDYEVAKTSLKTLETQLTKHYPHCQLIWFRNWYLKLKSTSSSNELIFFIDQKGNYGNHTTDITSAFEEFPPIPKEDVNILNSMFLGVPNMCIINVTDKSFTFRQNFLNANTTLVFSLATTPTAVLPEIQACRLVAHYCSFDPRVKPLLTVIRYWAKINRILLADSMDVSDKRAPDPAVLDWLVVFFLCHKMKILPTPREVTEHPHPILNWHNFDIGFSLDMDFAKTFSDRYNELDKERHSLNIFSLVIKFFKFYSYELRLRKGNKITLNTRDGEIIPTKEFSEGIKNIQTKLTLSERQMAKKGRNVGMVAEMAISLLHPLHPSHGFSLCDKNFVKTVCPAMQRTRKKLERKLDLHKKNGNKFDIKSVLQVIVLKG